MSAEEFSDPYLIGFYDKKELVLSHDQSDDVTFTLEVNPIGHGEWITYKKINVKAGESLNFNFPDSFQAPGVGHRRHHPGELPVRTGGRRQRGMCHERADDLCRPGGVAGALCAAGLSQ